MWWFAIFLMQDAGSQAERVRAAMAPSIEHQRESVKRQQAAVRATPTGVHATTEANGVAAWVPPIAAICDPLPQTELTRMIGETAQKVGIDGGLVREVARQESGFRPCAVSPKGAEGLMQLMPATQAQFAVANPFDPQQSLEAGSKLLKQLLDRYQGNLTLALSAYNAGAGCVDRSGGVPDIQETKNYVFNILSRAAGFDSPELQDVTPPLLAFNTNQSSSTGGCQTPAQGAK
jgi:soluble lytic murein transglycosylase-like protein